MRRSLSVAFPLFTLLLIVLVAGCASNKPEEGASVSRFTGEIVEVFVGSRSRGATPMTLHVSRSRAEYEVTLKRGQDMVRQYEIALENATNSSPERQAVFMDLEQDRGVMGMKTLSIDDLESRNDTLYYIPYYATSISIDDTDYGLTLVITD